MSPTATNVLDRGTFIFARNLGEPTRRFRGPSKVNPSSTVLHLEGKPVFRSGTFMDSEGEEATWDKSHMDQMALHFNLLRDAHILEDVPVRKYHPDFGGIFGGTARNPMDELLGYITSLRVEERENPVDKQTYSYLIADCEIIDPVAIEKIDSGLWRNVSAEIGPTFTNARAEYWPVFRGVAYVDFSAVEGLKQHAQQTHKFRMVTEEQMTTPAQGQPPLPTGSFTQQSAGTPPAQTAPQAPAAPTAQSFTLAGQSVNDPVAIQAALDELVSLREFRTTISEQQRVDFVQGLVDRNQVAVTQKDKLTAFAKVLDDTQFATWADSMKDAPTQAMLANHGSFNNNDSTYRQGASVDAPPSSAPVAPGHGTRHEAPQPGTKEWEIERLRGQVQTYVLANMGRKKIEALGSYQKLKQLDPNFQLTV